MSAITFDAAVAKRMLTQAIQFSGDKAGLSGAEAATEAIRRADCAVCEYLRHGLAKGIAQYLGAVDDKVKAVYTYEPEYATASDGVAPEMHGFTPGMNLVVWVSRKSAALSAVISALGHAVGSEIRSLACPKANALCRTLDVQVVDDGEVLTHAGYGALIDSVYVRPTQIWRR
jgi:hypothetical protein